jgi:hypothetical protein
MNVPNILKARLRHALAKRGLSLSRVDELTKLADEFGSDKGTLFDSHGYARIYGNLFEPFRNENLILVEIGLHRPESDNRRVRNAVEGATTASAARAPSLEMWHKYFPRARIFGFDIDDFSAAHIGNCTVIQGDMSSEKDLQRLQATVGESIDILIDDASHSSHHQQFALGYLFPYLRSGGFYVIEDLHWQDEVMERKGVPKTRDILRRLQINGALESPFISCERQIYLQDNVASVLLFDSLTKKVADPSDALGILVKK